MNTTDLVGSIGVATLLVAFVLNITGKISKNSLGYILMNIFGAGLACLASILLNYLPFIILEGVWTVISIIALFNRNKNTQE